MDATRSGLPVTVLHVFADTTATMRVKLLSLFTVVDASGPEMDRGETVTVFNDLVVMAPGAIVDAPATWTAIDALHVRGDFTDGDQTVSADLTFNAGARPRRLRLRRPNACVCRRQDLHAATLVDPARRAPRHRRARVLTSGEGVWHAPEPEGTFTYLQLHLDSIDFNVSSAETTRHHCPLRLTSAPATTPATRAPEQNRASPDPDARGNNLSKRNS